MFGQGPRCAMAETVMFDGNVVMKYNHDYI